MYVIILLYIAVEIIIITVVRNLYYVRVISYVTNIWAVNNRELNVWKSMAMGK